MSISRCLLTSGLLFAVGCSPSAVTTTNNHVTIDMSAENTSATPATEAKQPPSSPQEQFESVKSEYDAANETFITAYRSATDDDARKAARELTPDADDYVGRFQDIASANPNSETAVDALTWISTNSRGDASTAATKELLESYKTNPKIALIVMMMSYGGPEGTEERLRGVLDSENETVQAAARYSLGSILIKEDPASLEALELLQSVVDNFSDVEIQLGQRGIKIAPKAQGELTEATKLQIGMVAPDIEGADLDGVEFKLSDYRGKVVVLDFWGNW